VTAKRQCPDLIFVRPRFEVYKAVSQQIREIFAEHTPIIEPLSLDEAYLDVTENLQGIPFARDIALAIRSKIKEVTGLNASAGISYNKFLAKLASDHRKPNGQYVITPEMGPVFVETLPVGKFHGIGPATSAKMNSLGLYTGLDMRNQSLEFLHSNFGKAGTYYYWISRGVDNREVRADRVRKSIGAENTFSSDLTPLIDKVWQHCEDNGTRGRTVTLKVKFADFELISRSRTLAGVVGSRKIRVSRTFESPLPIGQGRQIARRFDIRIQTRRNSGRWADSPRALVKRSPLHRQLTSARSQLMSVPPSTADIVRPTPHVRFVPKH
jgi:DNA polymerase-4